MDGQIGPNESEEANELESKACESRDKRVTFAAYPPKEQRSASMGLKSINALKNLQANKFQRKTTQNRFPLTMELVSEEIDSDGQARAI